jgi:hypothetical protein
VRGGSLSGLGGSRVQSEGNGSWIDVAPTCVLQRLV